MSLGTKAQWRVSWKLPKQEKTQSILFSGMTRWDSGSITDSPMALYARFCPHACALIAII